MSVNSWGGGIGFPVPNYSSGGPTYLITPSEGGAAIQQAINSLPSCTVFDAAAVETAGQTGWIQLAPGVYDLIAPIIIPPGTIRLEGMGASQGAWNLGAFTPDLNTGGSMLVFHNVTTGNGGISVPVDGSGNPATTLLLRNLDMRGVSPATAQGGGTALLNLQGMWSGEVSYITCQEITGTGGLGNNIPAGIALIPSALTSLKKMFMCATGGFGVGIVINCDHIYADSLSAAFTGGSAYFSPGFDAAYYISTGGPQQTFKNMAAFSCTFGLAMVGGGTFQPTRFENFMWESCSHYLYDAGGTGPIIFDRPVLLGGVNPTTDVATYAGSPSLSVPGSGLYVMSRDEFDPSNAIGSGRHMAIPGYTGASITTPASPGAVGPFQFPCQVLVTTAGNASAVKLNNVQIGTTLTVNQLITLNMGDYLTITWTTTAPVFTIIPT